MNLAVHQRFMSKCRREIAYLLTAFREPSSLLVLKENLWPRESDCLVHFSVSQMARIEKVPCLALSLVAPRCPLNWMKS